MQIKKKKMTSDMDVDWQFFKMIKLLFFVVMKVLVVKRENVGVGLT